MADILIFCGVQGEVRHDKRSFLQVSQMEAKQTQNGTSVVLRLANSEVLFWPWIRDRHWWTGCLDVFLPSFQIVTGPTQPSSHLGLPYLGMQGGQHQCFFSCFWSQIVPCCYWQSLTNFPFFPCLSIIPQSLPCQVFFSSSQVGLWACNFFFLSFFSFTDCFQRRIQLKVVLILHNETTMCVQLSVRRWQHKLWWETSLLLRCCRLH